MNANSPSISQPTTTALPDLVASLLTQADAHPNAPVVIEGDITITYRRYADQVRKLSTSLFDIGVRPGDRVILHLGNCNESAIACYAVMMLGAIAVPLNVHYKPHELIGLIRRLQPAAYFGHLAQRKSIDEIAAHLLPSERRFYVVDKLASQRSDCLAHANDTWQAFIASAREVRQFPRQDPDATALLLCTSGSNGEPKLVAHAQRSLLHAVRYMQDSGFGPSTRLLLPTPLFNMPGIVQLCASVSTGACMVLPSCTDFDGAAFLDAIEQHRCTDITVTSFGAAEMIRTQLIRRRITDSLRTCVVTDDACSVELHQRFEQTFGIPPLCRFGMTEAPSFVVPGHTNRTVRARPGTARLVDGNGDDVTIAMPGELCLNVDTLFQGYWISPGVIDAARDANGWFHTGALARQDEHGDLTYLS
ncbi:class I adenylate-forming enzyme family protein [Paraburkholderia solisilvae]|uniref:Long-chain-fatty-acid--CoA ligase n=1 Tax=Paraburkholderia solisilvae TaxID=624376 RepID=A0A6J5DEN7_9BURK|nr:class I adenylate-forming enzyme family protein [Paraburkholderia solisilvae]CAB3751445.1 Long-chain-fatty-acid--CoA ligase [Paraburkholderia solisilvae]